MTQQATKTPQHSPQAQPRQPGIESELQPRPQAERNDYRGSKHLLDYSSTKGAIVAFTRSLALNLAPQKIRVNGVAPGPIWTPLIPATFDSKHVAEFGSDVPLPHAGQPAEVAPCYVFLASDDASYLTGQVLHHNGGEIINS